MNETFHSRFASQLREFVRMKRTFGHIYIGAAKELRSFDRFAVSTPGDLPALLTGWLNLHGGSKPCTLGHRFSTVRQFCLFRRRHDPGAFVPERSWAPRTTAAPFLPHIFSTDELRRVIDGTVTIKRSARTRRCLRLLVIVLYCTGLRAGEALGLKWSDVDLEQNLFKVGPSKGRTRWVPFRADVARLLRAWHAEESPEPDTLVFAQDNGHRRRVGPTSQSFRFLFRRLGLKPRRGRVGPRLHDLRHTFAVHCLQRWYRQQRDPQRMLPWLSAYLGHRNLVGTEHYLHATPELLATASGRLQRLLRFSPLPT